MITCSNLINGVCNTLSSASGVSDISFVSEFPAVRQDIPLRNPIVTVGVNMVKIASDSEKGIVVSGGSPCSVNVKLCLCVPKKSSGYYCYEVLDRVLAAARTLITGYNVTGITTGEMKYSSTIEGLLIPIDIAIQNGNAY